MEIKIMLRKNKTVNTIKDDTPNEVSKETKPDKEVKVDAKAEVKTKPKVKKAVTLPQEMDEVEGEVIRKDDTAKEANPEIHESHRGETVVQNTVVNNHAEGQGMATQPEQQVSSYSPSQVGEGALVQAAKAGYEGLEIGYGSFDILKLDGESFMLSDEVLKEKTISMVITQCRAKYIIKEVAENTDNFIYSYDQITDTKGIAVEVFKAKMHAAGCEIEIKKYLEAVAEIVDGPYDGEFVLLSIPPSSLKRFSGYTVKVMHKFGVNPDKVVTDVSVGKKIVKGKISWCPWKFTVKGLVSELIED